MPQSLVQLYTHLVYSTKGRVPLIHDAIREDLFAYMGGTLRALNSPSLLIGGTTDHVHILFCLSKARALTCVIEDLKKNSSKWIKTKGVAYRDFYWQGGYGAFSVSASGLDRLRAYIAGQAEHHRTESFQDELRRLLSEHGIGHDERYLWD